ncbi:Hypothetical_protein [Hexamita inflata]|uniref:Hypothetical_protein n=1 Tax=Hexamita inflata TaxID=28002 RepID=A0AA86UGM9_9EUKA|nr:Hypothetical protein HINF_LOCUS38027 [Hexamita inflata]
MESRKFVQIRPVSLGPVTQSSPKLIQIREDSEPEITELVIKKENNKHEKIGITINSEPPAEKGQIEAEIQILPVEINKVDENSQQPVVIKVRRRTIEEQKNEEPKIKNVEARALIEQFQKQLLIENALNQNNIQEQKIENIIIEPKIIDQVEVKTEIKTQEKPKEQTNAKQDKINKKEFEKKQKEDMKKQKELEKQQKELEKKQKEQEKKDKKNKNSKEAPKIETQELKPKEEVIQNTGQPIIQSQIEPPKINQQEQENNDQQELLTLAEQISKQNTLKFIKIQLTHKNKNLSLTQSLTLYTKMISLTASQLHSSHHLALLNIQINWRKIMLLIQYLIQQLNYNFKYIISQRIVILLPLLVYKLIKQNQVIVQQSNLTKWILVNLFGYKSVVIPQNLSTFSQHIKQYHIK